jgi:dienelactone hydrolase
MRFAGRARRLAVWLLLLAAAGCVARPDGSETLRVESRSFGFIGEMLSGAAGSPVTVDASLILPDSATVSPPYPALVLLHSSNGQGSQDWLYARRLREEGIAVLAVDSFSARDVSHTVRDQTLVSAASMLSDAFAALRLLQADPRIDPGRIGVIGFSKGGIAALYSVYQSVQARAAAASEHFALHIAYYPWCGLRLAEMTTTGAPVLIQSGALDDLVPPQRCAELITASEVPPDGEPIRQVVHPEAQHAFDHPLLAMFGRIPITAPSPANCRLVQQADGSFREAHSGTRVTAQNLKAALAPCSLPGHAGGNEAADDRAWRNTLVFLRAGGLLAAGP